MIKYNLSSISYNDSKDHFENALLRLLNINKNEFEDWLKYADEFNGPILDKLNYGWFKIKPKLRKNITDKKVIICKNNFDDRIWINTIAENHQYGIYKFGDFAQLAKFKNVFSIEKYSTTTYEENYFEGDVEHGGYSNYLNQTWRIEKAKRQLEEIIKITNLSSGKALDIGSGYGYFRNALEGKFIHDGIEVSNHACKVCKNIYGYDSFIGELYEYREQLLNQYDLITLWDVIEHDSSPKFILSNIYDCLKPNGFLVIKTPNIDCPEVDVFNEYYHSFKREHLSYFTKTSLERMANESGLKTHYITSNSHLLKGFVGEEITNKWAMECKGSDLIAYFKKE